MRTFSLLSLVLLLTACAADEAPDDGVSTAGSLSDDAAEAAPDQEVSTAGSATPGTEALTGIDGDWVYCDGPTALDDAVTVEGTGLQTYLNDRPASSMPFRVASDQLVLDDGRTFRGAVEGDVLRLTGDDGTSVYARSSGACP